MKPWGVVIVAAMLAACGQQAGDSAPGASNGNLMPSDPALAKLYSQTCKSCHAISIGGAPRTGDKAAWAPRLAQGMPTLLDHTIGGYKGMPPLGACADCGEKEFEALILFMAGETQ